MKSLGRASLRASLIGAQALATLALVAGCGNNDNTGTATPQSKTCNGRVCRFDEVCHQDTRSCALMVCDPSAIPDPCKTAFNDGFHCADRTCAPLPGYCDANMACPSGQACLNNLCGEGGTSTSTGASCATGGMNQCLAQGMYCSETQVCASPQLTCAASQSSGFTYQQGAPILWGVTRVDPHTMGLTPGSNGIPADNCSGTNSELRVYRVQYFAPNNDVPVTDAALYGKVYFFNASNPAGGPTWYTVAGSNPGRGSFVAFLCVLDKTMSERWAIGYRNNGLTSDAACFDIQPSMQ